MVPYTQITKKKKQHTVPTCYLNNFVSNNKIWVYDKISHKQFTRPPKNISHERYFYNVKKEHLVNENNEQMVEDCLSDLESFFSIYLKQVLIRVDEYQKLNWFRKLFSKKNILSDEMRRALALLIYFQAFRTKEKRVELTEFSNKIHEVIENSHIQTPANGSENELDEPLLHAKTMFNPESFEMITEAFVKHIWFLGLNTSNIPFYTSDNPVVKRGHIRNPHMGFEGYGSPGIEIAFPLSSEVILILCEREYFKKYRKLEGRVRTLNDVNISYYNSMQILQSHRQIYCSKQDFILVENIRKANPEVFNLQRERVEVIGDS